MSALPKSAESASPWWSTMEFPWAETARRAPVMVATMASYLDQLGVSARPTTVGATDQMLRHFAGQVTEADPDVHLHGRCRAPSHRGAQALAGRSAGQGREASRHRHHPQPARNVAHFLRAAAGLGLRRRAEPRR